MQDMAKNLRKAQQKLQSRIDSFESTVGGKSGVRNTGGFHKPGSMNRKKG